MPKTHLTAGVDAGSGAVKVAVMRSQAGNDGQLLGHASQRIRRRIVTDVVQSAFAEACKNAGANEDDFDYIASTGDGDTVSMRTGHFYGMTTHARGALFLEPEARAVLDVGALHARALRIDHRGKVLGHRMTSQCASGSGQFLENIGRYLGVPQEDVGRLSLQAKEPEKCSSICAVLAETDVINMVSRGIDTPDILKGIHLSIANRLARLLRAVKAEDVVALTGGMALDEGLVAARAEQLESRGKRRKHAPKLRLRAHEHSILAGAIGAALVAAYRYHQLEDRGRLEEIVGAAAAPA